MSEEICSPDLVWSQDSIKLSPDKLISTSSQESVVLSPVSFRNLSQETSSSIKSELQHPFEYLQDVSQSDQIEILNVIIPQLETLSGVSDVNFIRLVHLAGKHCNADLKKEANYFRSTESRQMENVLLGQLRIGLRLILEKVFFPFIFNLQLF